MGLREKRHKKAIHYKTGPSHKENVAVVTFICTSSQRQSDGTLTLVQRTQSKSVQSLNVIVCEWQETGKWLQLQCVLLCLY